VEKKSGIELLRFCAALSVLIYHFQVFFFPHNTITSISYNLNEYPLSFFLYYFYKYGFFGVDIFFVISGYIFSFRYLNTNNRVSLREYSLNRLSRLYPLHFLTLIVVLLLQKISMFYFEKQILNENNNIYHFILNLFFIHAWGFQDGHSFNTPSWSISIEIIAYSLFFFFIIKKKFNFFQILIIFMSLVLLNKFTDIKSFFYKFGFQVNITYTLSLFFMGVIIFFLFEKKFFRKLSIIFSSVFLVYSFIGNFKIIFFCAGTVIFSIYLEKYLNKKIKIFLNYLGDLSYGIYMWHIPIAIIIIIITAIFSLNIKSLNSLQFLLFFIILSLAISVLSFQFYEIKIKTFMRNYFKK
jgi:peptidoglycan/LPS O-acetylase OafA/YrhL